MEKHMNDIHLHICFADINFNCPHCNKEYIDDKDIYLKRINKNINFNTKIKCICGERFGVYPDYNGNLIGFKLK